MPEKDPGDHDRDELPRDGLAELLDRLHAEADERERLRIGRRIARIDADHPALESLGERRILFWCDLQPLVAARLLPGLSAVDPWVRRCAAETFLDAHLETAAVTACLLNELQQATTVNRLYDDRHHEIHDAAWGLQFDWLRAQWPWFVTGLLRLDAACPETWLDDPSITIQLNACRVLSHDDRVVPILRRCLDQYSWFKPSFWTFIAACELLSHLGSRAQDALPELEAVLADAPSESLPRLLAGALVNRISASLNSPGDQR